MKMIDNRNAPATARNAIPFDDSLTAVDTTEAARLTGLSRATLEKLRCNGGGPRFISYSRRAVRYRMHDLVAWIDERVMGSTSEARAAAL